MSNFALGELELYVPVGGGGHVVQFSRCGRYWPGLFQPPLSDVLNTCTKDSHVKNVIHEICFLMRRVFLMQYGVVF